MIVCKKRDMSVKGKRLRKQNIIPAVIFGKNLDESISIQIDSMEINKLFKSASVGSQISLDVDGTTYDTLLKNVDREPLSAKLVHLDFQVLTTGEKVKSSLHLNFVNVNAKLDGILQENLNTIQYEVLPKDMIESIDVDISEVSLDNDLKVEDLEIAKDPRYNILTPLNTTLVMVTQVKAAASEEEEEAEVEEV